MHLEEFFTRNKVLQILGNWPVEATYAAPCSQVSGQVSVNMMNVQLQYYAAVYLVAQCAVSVVWEGRRNAI